MWKCRTFKIVKNVIVFKKVIKFEIYLKIKIFKKIFKNIKKISKQLNGFYQSLWRFWTVKVNCIVNNINDCVLSKICESLNKIWKFYLKFWKFLKILWKF